MKREIKFRAWDGESMSLNTATIQQIANKNIFSRNADKLIWLQYTGLTDKNGKEIYEGDIIKWGHLKGSTETYHRVAIVEINPDIQFKIINYFDSINKKNIPTDNYVFRWGNFAYNSIQVEIIGNIYQNP